jgi:hypothetical protein
MLEIQTLLRSGKTPEEVCTPRGINFKELDGKVLFSYDMIDSYKFKEDPVVKESRGLILYKSDWSIACYPFRRFMNMGETGADVFPEDLSGCQVLEKIDGSMLSLWHDKTSNNWVVSTRGMIYAEGQVNSCSTKTFSQLFWEGASNGTGLRLMLEKDLLNKHCTYVFELTSPENRIVTPYKETKITLLTIRNNQTFFECGREELITMSRAIGCDLVKIVPLIDWESLLKMDVSPTYEGYVVLMETLGTSHRRVKVKNPAYLAIHRLASAISEKGFLELIKLGKHDDFLAIYPEYKEHVQKLLDGLSKIEYTIKTDWLEMPKYSLSKDYKANRKEFAAKAHTTLFPNVLFLIYDDETKLKDLKGFILGAKTEVLLDMIHKVNSSLPVESKQ